MHYTRKRDAQAGYLSIIKTALMDNVKIINFADPIQNKNQQEVLMHNANKESIYISSKYSLQVDPLHFEWVKFIPALEKHLPDIYHEILNHINHRYVLVQDQGQSIPANNEDFNTSLVPQHIWNTLQLSSWCSYHIPFLLWSSCFQGCIKHFHMQSKH